MSPTSLNRPIVGKGCIYNSSFLCVWSMGAIFQNLSPRVTLKMGSKSPKSQQYDCTSLVKMHPFILEQDAEKLFSNNLSPPVTLKTGSSSPKSNQFFFMSQQYRCTSLVKIHSFILEIGCRQAIFKQSEPSCDLKKWGQGH